MEGLYSKLYEKYSKLKSTKENRIDQINKEQEIKFVEFASASEELINSLTAINQRLTVDINELRNQVVSLRSDKDQQFIDFQELLMEKTQKIQQLSAEMEQLRNVQQERIMSSHRSEEPKERHANSGWRSPSVSRGHTNESPMRMTRKRARLSQETDPVTSSPASGHVQQSVRRKLLTEQSKTDHSKAECCQGIILDGGTSKCMFQGLVECLIGMQVSVADQPEGKCISAFHQSSGYSFSLTWVNMSSDNEGELMYRVTSLGTFSKVAPEWMREAIIFSMNMCPIFFERLSRVIKHH
ncbi:hypothetical protein RND81_12G178300 [Saponaria officinalis]|uniref:DUF7806 domain-containing protein n=1 Tax=Saponaria officinalis TaxID=3572 RepID=A0AAW1HC09_SAPOF